MFADLVLINTTLSHQICENWEHEIFCYNPCIIAINILIGIYICLYGHNAVMHASIYPYAFKCTQRAYVERRMCVVLFFFL